MLDFAGHTPMLEANRFEGNVTNVTVGSVFVDWIASAGYWPFLLLSQLRRRVQKT